MTAVPSDVRLIITDLDNTLYDWVTFFGTSFSAMAEELATFLELPIEQIYREFKVIHQHYGNSEQPFAILELPSVRRRFPTANREELLAILSGPLKAFNSARKKHLKLYPTVAQTLRELQEAGMALVGHTEAVLVNSYYRLQRLGIAPLFRRLYTLEDKVAVPPLQPGFVFPSPDFIQLVPRSERKPNPRLLLDICARENVLPSQTIYIGDSLTRDMSMAKESGVCAVWAKFGTQYDKALWKILVQITHWTDEDVAREEELRHRYDHVKPDYIVDEYSGLLEIVGVHQYGK
jgi:FMN phosphatase YigB (HAD superfamily)